MKAYILSIAGIVLLTAVISVISPHGKMGAFLKGVSKLAILVVMVSPVASFFTEHTNTLASSEISADTEYLAYCAGKLSEQDERTIEEMLYKEYGVTASAEVARDKTDIFDFENIRIKILDFGIIAQDEHIHIIEEISKSLEASYGCRAEVT